MSPYKLIGGKFLVTLAGKLNSTTPVPFTPDMTVGTNWYSKLPSGCGLICPVQVIFVKSKESDVTVIVCVGKVSPLIIDNCVAI